MKLHSLKDLYVDQLKDLYSAENQLIKALPKMAKAASSSELREGFQEHLEQTKNHAKRLEQICEQLDVTPKGKKCQAAEGLIEEGKELIEEDAEAAVMDAGLICAAQKVEHYEMATYGCARTWAEQLSKQIGAVVPDLVSWEWDKRERGGRARLDYTQNVHHKTLVAPYSPRAAPGAPVSAPIGWDELDDPSLRPDGFTIRTEPDRVAARGDDFRAVLGEGQQLPPIT